MDEQLEREIRMYDGKVFGFEVSRYGRENGYLDYFTLSKMVGACILNNEIVPFVGFENWSLESGEEWHDEGWYDIYQYYIITEYGAKVLSDYTDEIVYYNSDLDMYIWGVTHFGTGWDYVLTDIKLVGEDD